MQLIGYPYTPVHPLAIPGCCYLCKSAPNLAADWVIDTMHSVYRPGLNMGEVGRVYICHTCFTGMANLIDFRAEELEELNETIHSLEEIVKEKESQLGTKRDFVAIAKEILNAFPEEGKARKSDRSVADARLLARNENAEGDF